MTRARFPDIACWPTFMREEWFISNCKICLLTTPFCFWHSSLESHVLRRYGSRRIISRILLRRVCGKVSEVLGDRFIGEQSRVEFSGGRVYCPTVDHFPGLNDLPLLTTSVTRHLWDDSRLRIHLNRTQCLPRLIVTKRGANRLPLQSKPVLSLRPSPPLQLRPPSC